MTNPFIGAEEVRALHDEIAADGFEADPFIASGRWPPVWGLNLAFGWPLPLDDRAYHDLTRELGDLDPALSPYPHHQTHVTVLTLISFKQHVEPSLEEIQTLEESIPSVKQAVAPAARGLSPFEVQFGPPVLSRRAVFLPLLDQAGAVARLRSAVLGALRASSTRFDACAPPRAVHSTIARFRATPSPDLARRFDDWARGRTLGRARVSSLLITTETRPYMREGRVVAAYPLW